MGNWVSGAENQGEKDKKKKLLVYVAGEPPGKGINKTVGRKHLYRNWETNYLQQEVYHTK